MQPYVRWMITRDMEEVVAIEQASFEAGTAWTEEDFKSTLRNQNCIGMVVEEQGEGFTPVHGYMLYELHKSRLELLKFAVHPDFRHQGFGKAMVNKLKAKMTPHRRRRIGTFVRETNLDAQLFFKAMGFRALKVMRKFYDDTGEDGYRMCWKLAYANKPEQEVQRT